MSELVENLQSIACYEGGQFHPWMGEVAGEAAKALERSRDSIRALAAALEAAYSQKGADDDTR